MALEPKLDNQVGNDFCYLKEIMKLEYKIRFDDLEWICPGNDIRYKCYQHNGYQLRLVEFGKNMEHVNWCFNGHYGFIVSGEMELVFSDQVEVYQTGDAIFIPDGEAHKHRPRVLSDKVRFFSVEKI